MNIVKRHIPTMNLSKYLGYCLYYTHYSDTKKCIVFRIIHSADEKYQAEKKQWAEAEIRGERAIMM